MHPPFKLRNSNLKKDECTFFLLMKYMAVSESTVAILLLLILNIEKYVNVVNGYILCK